MIHKTKGSQYMYETLNSYSMIAKTINYDGPRFHPFSDPFTQARSTQAVELTRRDDKRALERLIENLALPVPKLSKQGWGRGFLQTATKMIAEKQNSQRLLHTNGYGQEVKCQVRMNEKLELTNGKMISCSAKSSSPRGYPLGA